MIRALMILVSIGPATWYAGQFVGRPLYCDTRHNDLSYRIEGMPPWVALPVELYKQGDVECGDWLRIEFEDGSVLAAKALDAGPLSGYGVAVDVPKHLHPHPQRGIVPARVYDLSRRLRREQ